MPDQSHLTIYPRWVPPKGWVPYVNPDLTEADIDVIWARRARDKRRRQAAERGEDWRNIA